LQQPPIGDANGPPSEQFNCVQPRLQPVRQHTSACIRQHTSAYVRQHTSALASNSIVCSRVYNLYVSIRQLPSAYVSIRQHTAAYVSIWRAAQFAQPRLQPLLHVVACVVYVSIRQYTAEYVSMRQHMSHTSAYGSIRQHMSHTSAYAQPRLQPLLQVIASGARHRCETSRTKLLQNQISATQLLQTLKLVLLNSYKPSN
jgi:hypothetical protein